MEIAQVPFHPGWDFTEKADLLECTSLGDEDTCIPNSDLSTSTYHLKLHSCPNFLTKGQAFVSSP